MATRATRTTSARTTTTRTTRARTATRTGARGGAAVAIPAPQATGEMAAAEGAHVSASGGVFTAQFLASLAAPAVSFPEAQAASFGTPWAQAPSQSAHEKVMGDNFELVVEQWDRVRGQLGTMSVSELRERWLKPLFDGLDFHWVYQRADTVLGEEEELRFGFSHRGWAEVGAPIIHTVAPQQALDARVEGQRGPKGKSPHDMTQFYLNIAPDDRWAIVTNGRFLRILRRYHQVNAKGYVEFDLEGICETRALADWRALYRLAHASRFYQRGGSDGAEGWRPLDRLYDASVAAGVKVGEQLQGNVRRAIQELATGFLDGPTITRLRGDEAATRDFAGEVLHVVYRLLFLLYAEQRGMLPGKATLYAQEYSVAALRERASRDFPQGDRFTDLWEGLKATFHMVAAGVPALGVFGYNGELFNDDKTPTLNHLACQNGRLLQAIRALTFVERGGRLQRINYLDVDVEEIGAVYESLLDYTPRITGGAVEVISLAAAKDPTPAANADGDADAGDDDADDARPARKAKRATKAAQTQERIPANHFYLDPRGVSRKTSGSYYTRRELVDELVDSALKPVVEAALAPTLPSPEGRGNVEAQERALLALRVVDPACGSGAFLIAATEYLGRRLARIRTGDDFPGDADLRKARREVLMRCIYGVDVNPMAVELAKVSLWIHAAVDHLPLNFLDHHIKCGNALIGATPELLAAGLPDAAFTPVAGDDKAVASQMRRLNKEQRTRSLKHGAFQQLLQPASDLPIEMGAYTQSAYALGVMAQNVADEVHLVRIKNDELERNLAFEKLRASAWCAAFFWPLDQDAQGATPTFGDIVRMKESPYHLGQDRIEMIKRLAADHRFFHWYLEFPDIFGGGDPGFDCVLGNPPWERIKLQEEEFFAPRAPEIANAPNAAARKALIAQLPQTRPDLDAAYRAAQRRAAAQSKFFSASGRYPLTAHGDINLYSIFAESDRNLISSRGRAGIIVPTGIATDDTNKDFFGSLVGAHALASLYDFENRAPMFSSVDSRYKFCLLTMTGAGQGPERADLVSFAQRPADLTEHEHHVTLSPADFALMNPNTRTLPIFRTQYDANLTRHLYHAAPVLIDESGAEARNPWGVKFLRMFDMSNDSKLFRTREQLVVAGYALDGAGVFHAATLPTPTEGGVASGADWRGTADRAPLAPPAPQPSPYDPPPVGEGRERAAPDDYLPLYEAKLFHQYDHRFATFEGVAIGKDPRESSEQEHANPSYAVQPDVWISQFDVETKLSAKNWPYSWLLAYRGIARSTDERTLFASVLPRFGVGNSATVMLTHPQRQDLVLCLLACLESIGMDFIMRQKAGGMNLNFFIVKQLPVLPPETYAERIGGERLGDWVTRRALELTYTSETLRPLARDLGYDGQPFAWDDERRAWLRGELDGMYAHLYGLSRAEFAYILTTFPVLQKNEQRRYGEYRTARLALAAYDALAADDALAGVI